MCCRELEVELLHNCQVCSPLLCCPQHEILFCDLGWLLHLLPQCTCPAPKKSGEGRESRFPPSKVSTRTLYISLPLTYQWPHPATREAGKCSLYLGDGVFVHFTACNLCVDHQLSKFSLHMNHLGILLKGRLWFSGWGCWNFAFLTDGAMPLVLGSHLRTRLQGCWWPHRRDCLLSGWLCLTDHFGLH